MAIESRLLAEAQRLTGLDGSSPHAYPGFVTSAAERDRWTLSLASAAILLDAQPESKSVWLAARTIYRSDLPTGEQP